MNYCLCECDPYSFWDISYKEYMEMTPIRRMAFLRSIRLHLIEQKRKDKSERELKEYLFEKWLKTK